MGIFTWPAKSRPSHVAHIPRRVETHVGTSTMIVAKLRLSHVGLWVHSLLPSYPVARAEP